MSWQQSQELTTHLNDNLEMLSKDISSGITIRSSWMRTTLQYIQHRADAEQLAQSFVDKDRQQLFQHINRLYQNLKQRNHVTHMYFIDMQRSVVLRMHQPNRFGDVIERGTLREAEHTGFVSSGVELGTLGTLTLRVVLPWVYQGHRIGYLEMGIELEDILHEIESSHHFSIFLMLEKEALDSSNWLAGQSLLGQSNNWELFKEHVISFPIKDFSDDMAMITAYLNRSIQDQPYIVDINGLMYGMTHLPFRDASGDEIGQLMLMMDLSVESVSLRQAMYSMMGVLLFVIFPIVLLLCVIISRSERARDLAEEELKLAGEALSNTVECIMITDDNGMIVRVNRAFENVTGYAKEEAIGNNLSMLKSDNQDQEFYEAMWRSIHDTGAWHGRLVNKRKNGELYPVRLSITAIKNSEGSITNYIGIFSDMTESEMLEQRLHENNKMESLNTLVGGIAHEFNNMLASMTGNLYLARVEMDASSKAAERLVVAERVAFQASDIIRRLLAFTSQDIVSKSVGDVLPLVHQAIDSQQEISSQPFQIEMHASNGTFVVEVNKPQLLQILDNLISNAVYAVKQKSFPEIVVNVDHYVADESFMTRHPNILTVEMVRVTVSDNGCGISDKHMEYIFDPFYTTKEVGDGPGLGLSMVYGAMKSYGGAVEVESKESEGTLIQLFFPMYKQDPSVFPLGEDSLVCGDGETILLVDDDVLVLDTACKILKSLGYQVLLASNGKEAVSCYEKSQHDIDLVMLDVVMPVMGGIEVASAIRTINSNVKLLFSTGFDVSEKLKLQMSKSGDIVLNKPYHIKRLSFLLQQILNPNKK